MKETTLQLTANPSAARSATLLSGVARRLVLSALAKLEGGCIVVSEPGGSLRLGVGEGAEAHLTVHEPSVWADVALRGTVGFGEAYVRGSVTCGDLVGLVRLLLRERKVVQALDSRMARLAQPALRLFHALRENTLQGSRTNIEAHYDLGNEFYALWLDPTLSYSAAIFERSNMTLEQASRAKNARVCAKLALAPGQHLLEIGSGWGSLALHAARAYGARVTTTTLSQQQFAYVRERVDAAGLGDQIQVLCADYRELRGNYDKVVSIEMIEAVGHRHYDTYFAQLARLLKPDGLALIQSITIEDQRYESAKDDVDFVKRYIFPGSCIPSLTALATSATRASDLRLVQLEDITLHYAMTLRAWHQRFDEQRAQVRALGYSDAFCRMWEVYLSYCEAAFWERYLGDQQLVFARPGARALPQLLPLPELPREAAGK